VQISKLHNSLYNKDFYTASKFHIKFFRFQKFFRHHLTGLEKPENNYTVSNIKEAHVQKYSATIPDKTQYRRENLSLKRLNIRL